MKILGTILDIGIDHADNEKQSFIAAGLSRRYRTVNLLQKYAEDGPAISGSVEFHQR